MIRLTEDQIQAISTTISYNADYGDLSPELVLQYMVATYITPLNQHCDIHSVGLGDCGSGFGWLAFAYLLSGGKSAFLAEPDIKKLEASKKIAEILGVESRCVFSSEKLQDISLPNKSIDVFVSVETLEHVGKANIRPAVENIIRLTKQVIVLTAPNQLFPMVSHDAYVPFSHWLPLAWRHSFCRFLGIQHHEFHHFPFPWHLKPLHRFFAPRSRVLVFGSYRHWLNRYPIYSPYNGGVEKIRPPKLVALYMRIVSIILGRYSFIASPNLASIWIAKNEKVYVPKQDEEIKISGVAAE
ncbi:class I SAM-dependent methyltransferase [Kordiimonas pumila]|uniref:Class I SAM-dependent methyltransferase n=1 Tax=Kordiimonas pumila TaxID=2161677 RepID=A0ABV7D884_9PROT|nr:class I SAM-dependent methyltransferase [Kordiimonas pumila]